MKSGDKKGITGKSQLSVWKCKYSWCLYGLSALAIIIAVILLRSYSTSVPDGQYRSMTSDDVMTATKDTVRIRRAESTWATLPNKASGQKLFDMNDLAEARPQHLKIIGNGKVEHISDAVPPFPEQRLTFERMNR